MAEPILEEKIHMKRVSAVICELNPLHSGHEALLSHASEVSDVLICVMSGNFTQRSECALYDKYKRAEAAVRLGADIVAELPFPYSSAGAEFFALGGVAVGVALGCEHFIFGSESADTNLVSRAADAAESDEFAQLLSPYLKGTDGAAAAHDEVMRRLGFALGSNDKLAMHYMLAARKIGAEVSFEAFGRMCEPGRYKSASELRKMIFDGDFDGALCFIPRALHGVYPHEPDILPDRLAELEYIHYRMRPRSGDGEHACFEGEGGVSQRLWRSAYEACGHRELFARAATKRYTDSRLRRAALYELLCVRREDVTSPPVLTQLLAASRRGREYLASKRRAVGIRILTKPSVVLESESEKCAAELMRRADELYLLCMRRQAVGGEFLRRSPYIE